MGLTQMMVEPVAVFAAEVPVVVEDELQGHELSPVMKQPSRPGFHCYWPLQSRRLQGRSVCRPWPPPLMFA